MKSKAAKQSRTGKAKKSSETAKTKAAQKDVSRKEKMKELYKQLLGDLKHTNNIVEALECFDGKSSPRLLSTAMGTLPKMLEHVVNSAMETPQHEESSSAVTDWLLERLEEVEARFREVLHHPHPKIPDQAVFTLISLLPLHSRLPGGPVFCDKSLLLALEEVLCNNDDQNVALGSLCNYVEEYVDLREGVLRCLKVILHQDNAQEYACSTMALMLRFPFDREKPRRKLCAPLGQSSKVTNTTSQKVLQKLFSEVWEKLIRLDIPLHLYKKVLLWLPDSVLPHLREPLCTTDFFMEAFDKGGVISVLALNGIFLLIAHYHLEYRDFYTKVYSMLKPELLHAKYRSRFFYLLNIFLSSTHISEALVAAFAKRLSRLCLCAPPAALQIIIPFLCNIFIRYPSLERLLHRTNKETLEEDPFDDEALDPCDSHAQDSCLWELDVMRKHVSPEIATLASFIEKPLPKIEEDLSERLDRTADEMVEKEVDENMKDVPLTFTAPEGILGKDSLWELA